MTDDVFKIKTKNRLAKMKEQGIPEVYRDCLTLCLYMSSHNRAVFGDDVKEILSRWQPRVDKFWTQLARESANTGEVFSREDDDRLADILWWIKGFRVGSLENDSFFGPQHEEALRRARIILNANNEEPDGRF